jgi:hypothetical protein
MGDEDDHELGPGVAQHVKHQDAPIDKKAALNAVLAAIVQTGTSGKGPGTVPLDGGTPTNAPQPISIKEFNSGVSPSVTYNYVLGPDGKIYGKGDEGRIPDGPAQHLHIVLRHGYVGWTASIDVSRNDGPGKELVKNSAKSGAPNSVYSEADSQRIKALAESGQDGKADTQMEHRQNQFTPSDATTAVRQALVKLQIRNALYDGSKVDAPPVQTAVKSGRPPWVVPAVVAAVVAVAVIAALVLGGGKSTSTKVAADSALGAQPAVTPVTGATKAPQIVWRNEVTTVQDAGDPCRVTNTITYRLDNGAQFAGEPAVVVFFGLDYKDHPTKTFTVTGDGSFVVEMVNTHCYDEAAGIDNQTGTALVSVGQNTNMIPPTDAIVPH